VYIIETNLTQMHSLNLPQRHTQIKGKAAVALQQQLTRPRQWLET